MKRLLLMRHAKSDWGAAFRSDRERPLNRRGTAAAMTMGRLLARVGEIPDLVYASSAVRATETALLAAASGDWGIEPVTFEELYGASPDDTLAVVGGAPAAVDRLMIVGHQPTWGQLLQSLTGSAAQIKTATVAAVDLAIDAWDQAPWSRGALAYLLQPKLFTKWEM
jgi:phosphohistidine phosphatase